MAFLNKGLEITLRDDRPHTESEDDGQTETEVRFCYEGGLVDYVNHINSGARTPIHREVIDFEAHDDQAQMSLELAMQWNSTYGEAVHTLDRKSTRLNSSHVSISYAVFCLKNKR